MAKGTLGFGLGEAVVVVLACWGFGAAHAGPIPGSITKSGLTIDIEDFTTLPATGSTPDARINFLREEPGGADRLFANDLNGFLYTLNKSTKTTTTYLDFTAQFPQLKTSPGLASGLVTFAFHPDFATNGKLYTVHSEFENDGGTTAVLAPPVGVVEQHSVLTEWTATDPAADTFSGTRREVMRLGTVGRIHPMGDLLFDNGLLHVAIGDGQSFNTGNTGNLQRLDSYLGTVLRIDPDPDGQPMLSSNGAYSIPASNPFFEDANHDQIDDDPTTFGEILAYGFRNPHRISLDAATGSLLATDIGEQAVEEVNLITPGGNYGWAEREGTFLVGGGALPTNDNTLGFSYPVAQYDHDEGRAIAGGFVYRGSAVPELRGKFVFGDIVNGRIFYSELDDLLAADDGDAATTADIHELQLRFDGADTDLLDIVRDSLGDPSISRTDLRFGVDNAGELYILTKQDGVIRTLVSQPRTGDYNGDGFVSQADLNLVLLNWGNNSLPPDWVATDQFDGGLIGQNELNDVLLNWGDGTPPVPAGAAVPEPGTVVIVLFGALVAVRRRSLRLGD
ncbi:MAG: PQQ-dependent sugar dehydrogenase [Planctomycetota bacterium]